MTKTALCLILLTALTPGITWGQEPVIIHVDADAKLGPFKPISAYYGYDEPNYTYTENGSKLIGELAAGNYAQVYVRTHFLLATGDGTAELKWGSTNAYTEDASGKPVYDWKIVDRIFDTYLQARAKPFVEIGFMPEALSSKPEPYQPTWVPGAANRDYSIGWSYPPKDYDKWGELIYQWVKHCVEKYGKQEVESWYWEVWNEPDISYWHGTPEEYDKLYDYSAAAVKRALPSARIGGPAITGPSGRSSAFLQQFLEHCDHGKNLATAGTGAPLDFITYHAKGSPSLVEGRVRMGLRKNLLDVDRGYEVVAGFPKFHHLPIVLSESDPEGCAACSARVYPPNAYRNGTIYPTYTAVMFKNIQELAERRGTNIEGMLTWAFEFEGQPYFDGFRTLATNGVDKPVLNFFRMAGLMHGDRIKAESSGSVPLDDVLKDGVHGSNPDVDALAVRSEHEISVMVWNYHDDDEPAPDADIKLNIGGVPSAAKHVLLRHYRIDQTHSNAYTAWKNLGSPQNPTAEQYTALEAAGQLQELDSPRWVEVKQGGVELNFKLPRHAVSLVQVSW